MATVYKAYDTRLERNVAIKIIRQYLRGGTLKTRMGKPIPWRQAARLLIPIAQALGYAHELKVIHRDAKPANILLTEKSQPMLTGTGMGVGTPEYMAPEQTLGKEVDGRADIYSLGIIFYELITGRKPYTADTPMAVIFKQLSDPLPRPRQFVPDLPEAVERVLFKALAKKPQERYADAEAFAAALENLEGMTASAPPARANADSSETIDTLETI